VLLPALHLLIEGCAVGDNLCLAQPRGQVNLELTPPERRALYNEALVQRISLCNTTKKIRLQVFTSITAMGRMRLPVQRRG
jgi:hypothetical protein